MKWEVGLGLIAGYLSTLSQADRASMSLGGIIIGSFVFTMLCMYVYNTEIHFSEGKPRLRMRQIPRCACVSDDDVIGLGRRPVNEVWVRFCQMSSYMMPAAIYVNSCTH